MKKLIIICIGIVLISSCSSENENATVTTQNIDTTAVQTITESSVPTAERIEFTAADGLIVSGLMYAIDDSSATILLCHQAGFNLHEYDEIAPKLNEIGYNCIAIDQRSGGIMEGIVNETADRALDAQLPMDYVAAEQDITAAIDFASSKFNQAIILWGSSYSAGLALHMAEKNDNIRAVIAFSPGDYYGTSKPKLQNTMKTLKKPYFITSSKRESEDITTMLKHNSLDSLHQHFIPKSAGIHGSKALWKAQPDNKKYWNAIQNFLIKLN